MKVVANNSYIVKMSAGNHAPLTNAEYKDLVKYGSFTDHKGGRCTTYFVKK